MKPGRIVAYRADRLGARLLSLVNAIRLAEDHGFRFAMHWVRTPGVGKEFNDPTEIFDETFVAEHFIDADDWRANARDARTITANRVLSRDELAGILDSGRDVRLEVIFGTVIVEGEDRDHVARRNGEVFRALPLSPRMQPLFARLGAAFGGAVGYHLRRGDISSSLKARNRPWPHKFVPSEYYLHHMGEALEGHHSVVVFSDDEATIAEMRAAFPEVRRASELLDFDGLSPAQRDYLELCAMSACDKLIAPESSAFSSAASQLGNVPKRDVKSDLSATAREAAEQDLNRRLAEQPGSFATEGDIGQSLDHARAYLAEAGRETEAFALYRRYVHEHELQVSFVFRDAMALALKADQPEEALAIADLLPERQVYHTSDLASCLILEAVGATRLGDFERARRALVRALWHQGDAGAFKRIGPALLLGGALDAQSFLPVSPDAIGACGVALSLSRLEREKLHGVPLSGLLDLAPASGGAMLDSMRHGSLLPVWGDWHLLLGYKPLRTWLAKSFTDREEAQLAAAAAAERPDAPPGIVGTLHMLRFHGEESGRGPCPTAGLMEDLASEYPEDAMTWQRLSHVCYQRRMIPRAVEAAQKALDLLECPGLHAWAGMCMMSQARHREAAVAHLTHAVDSGLPLATVPAFLHRVLGQMGDHAGALAAIDKACALAPNEARLMFSRAETLVELDAPDEAVAQLETLIAEERAHPAVFALLARIEAGRGQPARARAALAAGLAGKPGDPGLAEQLKALDDPLPAPSQAVSQRHPDSPRT